MDRKAPLFALILTALVGAIWLPGLQSSPTIVTRSSWPAGNVATVLRGPYLQLATPTSIVVKWRTGEPTQSRVYFGTVPDQLTQSRGQAPLAVDHEIRLNGLQPSTRYYYAVADGETILSGGTRDFSFLTPPPYGRATPTRVWAFGDSGTADAHAAAVRDAYTAFTAGRPTSLWLMLGDNAYDRGRDTEFQAALFETYPQWLRRLPLYPAYGNHDADSANSATQTGPYFDIFTLPKNGEAGGLASGTEAYYSFDYGNVHFICLNSEDGDRSPNGPMLTWLANDLSQNNQEWLIAYWHHPPYSKGSHDSDSERSLEIMRENALPILEAWGTDLVLSGHSHAYERSFLLDGHYGRSHTLRPSMVRNGGDGREDGSGVYFKPLGFGAPNEGTVYAVAGSGGKLDDGPFNHPAMFLSLEERGSLVLDIYGNRMDAQFLNVEGKVRDHFTILKGNDNLPPAIISVRARNEREVSILFAEPLDAVSASDASAYSVSRGVLVYQAELETNGRTVLMTTSPLTPGLPYTLTVEGLADLAGNRSHRESVAFDFQFRQASAFQDGALPTPAYAGARDTYISQVSPDENFGRLDVVRGDGISGQPALIPLLSWDLSNIPRGAQVESVELTLNIENSSGGFYQLFDVRREWRESEATWRRSRAGQAWANPGTSAPQDRGSETLSQLAPARSGLQTFSLDSPAVAVVQGWVDGRTPNYGFLLRSANTNDGIEVSSRETNEASRRPKLTVNYTVPSLDPTAEVHIAGISMGLRRKGARIQATARITILDGNDMPASDVLVSSEWSGLARGPASGLTEADGSVTLVSPFVPISHEWSPISVPGRPAGRFMVSVTAVEAEGRVHNSSADLETAGCIDKIGRPCG